MGYRNSIDVPG
jgi:hypothetical protein